MKGQIDCTGDFDMPLLSGKLSASLRSQGASVSPSASQNTIEFTNSLRASLSRSSSAPTRSVSPVLLVSRGTINLSGEPGRYVLDYEIDISQAMLIASALVAVVLFPLLFFTATPTFGVALVASLGFWVWLVPVNAIVCRQRFQRFLRRAASEPA